MAKRRDEYDLKKVMARVFGVSPDSINKDASPDTVEKWDSLAHMSLILALEEAFGITLSEEETVEILSYPLIKIVLAEHGIEFEGMKSS